MADVKSLLKEARKLIDDKNFKEAQECCKNILRKDKNNYLGLVLLGKSLAESDQAPLAFQKAISSKPDHPLAWQGLANYYEKKADASAIKKLLAVYDEILKLQIDQEKALEIVSKVGQLGCIHKDNLAISILVNYMNRKMDMYTVAEKELLGLLKADIICKEEDIPNVVNIIRKINDREPNDSIHILLGKVILQKSEFEQAMKEVMELPYFTSGVVFRDWLCKYLCTYYIQNNSFKFDLEKYFNEITLGIENSKYPGLLKSMILFDKQLYLEAYKQCVPLVNYNEADLTEVTFIIKCTFMLKKWSVSQKLSTNFLMKVKDSDFAITLRKFLFLSLVEQQKWKQAISVSREIPFESLDLSEQAALAKCYLENNEDMDDHLRQNLETTHYFTQLEALSLIKHEKYNEAISLLEKKPEDPLSFFYIGKAYWELKEYEKSQINLLKAAKLNADHTETFLYLGMFYQNHKNDFAKAKKCYEKAYSLDSTNINVIKNLSDIYVELELKDSDFELLLKSSQSVQTEFEWVTFRLGLYYINKRDWENAILQFRHVIKHNHKNVIAFECLADAYYSRGSFTSALKAYNKVMSVNPKKALHCLTRIGYIHSLLREYDEAISTFKRVFEIDPFSLLALKGIAETWMRIARKKYTAKLYGSARDTAQTAINYLIIALSKETKFTCFWNLMADALIFITRLPNKYSYVYITEAFGKGSEDIIRKDKSCIYPQALACLSRIAKQKSQFTSYDLASTYLDYYLCTQNIVNCQIAFKLTVACIKDKPSTWRNWNLLGKVCYFMKKYVFAQHCFIKALLVTRKWSIAQIWCNLGTLYLKLKLYKLANYCFWRGQSTLPSHPHSWIGQGLIAEVIREEEAMDLFRHACRLGYHPESSLGYADWVCRTLKNDKYEDSTELKYVIDGLSAIPYALDLLSWFSTFETDNSCASNILGILHERSGLLNSALNYYQKALEDAEECNKNMILLNIGRIYIRLTKYDEAIKTYKSISEASLNSTCGLALALFKNGLYEESYSAYDTALHWLSNNDDEKADLLVAMSGIVYMFKGLDDAKTLLFHSIQVSQKKPTAYSLFAICSLGIIHSDQGLSKLALSELKKYEKDNNFGFDIGFLKSYLFVNEDLNQAIKILSDSLHDHPNNTKLWFCLAQYCLQESDTKARLASCCAQRSLASNYENNVSSAKMLATASIAEHVGGDKRKASLLAKQGLHTHPDQPEVWAALLLSIVTNTMWHEKRLWISSATGHMRKNLNITRSLARWINLLDKKISTQVN
ncbi:superkiller complex protein 3 [Danaus plexippus]|uniref:superkiller complex protein 3 n=1 Tax=Danaus plexippus TaxID=13037 RepID=UPI002AB2D060|nr:superkiller complex protein 3 [Danaus plexippus]